MELREEQVVEIDTVTELQGGGERRRGGAAELRLARVRELCGVRGLYIYIYISPLA